jgi:methionyl aminopeptidase
MIIQKTSRQILKMQEAGRIAANALHSAGRAVEPGVTTLELDTLIRKYIEGAGATPSFLGYGGFPGSACISVNDVVIHGIPSRKIVIKEGDIVSIDVGAFFNGYHGDTAYTFACGAISAEARRLVEATEECFHRAFKQAVCGNRIGDIGFAVQEYAEACGYSVVRDFVGHGVGTSLHEDPQVPNFGSRHRGVRLEKGMTLAIEPMINQGLPKVKVLDDEWTVITNDGKLSSHYEHTVAITSEGPVILTIPDADL